MMGFDPIQLLPMIVLAAASVLILLVLAVHRSHALTMTIASVALAVAGALVALPAAGVRAWTPVVTPDASLAPISLLSMDGYAAFFTVLILAQTLLIAGISYSYLRRVGGMVEEYYVLLLTAALGAVVLAGSTHFVSFFLGLELLSISLYPLIAYHRAGALSVEAGFKYLLLAAAAAAVLLFGMALLYADTGTMQFSLLAELIPQRLAAGAGQSYVLLGGLALLAAGVAFKMALVPLHLWTPDVYQGAPAPVTAFIASVSKGAVFALLLRYFTHVNIHAQELWPLYVAFMVLAIGSMTVGNFLALMQNNVKRLLAYSSISQLGYIMVAFLSAGTLAMSAAAFYLAAYFAAVGSAFGVVAALSGPARDAQAMSDFRGLAWRRPVLAAVMAGSLLSLAGMPLTAGFMGKLFLVAAGVESGRWVLVIALAVNSAIAIYYYVRVIAAMYMRQPEPADAAEEPAGPLHVTAGASLAVLSAGVVFLGVYPDPILRLIEFLMRQMG